MSAVRTTMEDSVEYQSVVKTERGENYAANDRRTDELSRLLKEEEWVGNDWLGLY